MTGAIRRSLAAAAATAVGVLFAPAAHSQPMPILVVVESLEADPTDADVLIVVRTTAAGAVESGSLVLEAVDKDGGGAFAFASVVDAMAFSTAGDAVAAAVLDVPSQRIDVSFSSATGTINEAFGPLVAVRLALQPGLAENERFDIRVVPGLTVLTTPTLETLDTLADRGRLRLRAPDPGVADIGPLGGEVVPGEVAVFGAATGHPFAIGSGTIEILFDATIADGAPDLIIDPRYGSATIDSIDVSVPGRVLAAFTSPAGDLNQEVYGMVFAVALTTSAAVPVGFLANLELGPATALFAPNNDPLLVEGGDVDVVDFILPELVLRAGFEEGDVLEFTEAH